MAHLETHLVLLTSEDVAHHWDRYAPGIERGLDGFVALPTHEVMNNILAACLSGQLQMWAVRVVRSESEIDLAGVLITAVLDNPITGLRSMWIYGIAPHYYDQEIWTEALNRLQLVAKKANCWQIQTFVRRGRMLEALKDMGADVETRAITWRIE
jgi:hypothetical protein